MNWFVPLTQSMTAISFGVCAYLFGYAKGFSAGLQAQAEMVQHVADVAERIIRRPTK